KNIGRETSPQQARPSVRPAAETDSSAYCDLDSDMTNLRFVITGGPGAGKTTILHALAERGYRCAPESARAIIRERLASGLPPRPPLAQFGHEILHRDIARYRETQATDHPVFFDRGVVDALGILEEQQALSLGET